MRLTLMTRMTLTALAVVSLGTAAALIWVLVTHPLRLLTLIW